jgi:hypothetical protein
MLYDVFISHASEDKDAVVRPLAERLRQSHLEVWYDEFSLKAGDSLRRSIDLGLSQSRFGIAILSPAFFGKGWTEWELDGLVQRQVSGGRTVIIPVWHGVTRADVERYSPPLADKVAIPSVLGIDEIVRCVLAVVRPEGSTLLIARDILIERGLAPPVVTDDWWLDRVERVSDQRWNRWSLNLPMEDSDGDQVTARDRGKRLAWFAMEQIWQQRADDEAITQLTHPARVLDFIETSAGLREALERDPAQVLYWAPQLCIPGLGGWMEPAFDALLAAEIRESEERRARGDRFGTGITTNALTPACDEGIALRHPTFGDYEPPFVANAYVDGNGGGMGPSARFYDVIDYAAWFVSEEGTWLPPKHRACLLDGMKQWAVWLWHEDERSYSGFEGARHTGKLWETLYAARERKVTTVEVSGEAFADLHERLEFSCELLSLPETPQEMTARFLAAGYIEAWLDQPRRLAAHRAQTKTGKRKQQRRS